MPRRVHGSVLRSIQTLFSVGTVGGMTDGQLLEQFLCRRDEGAEAAFAALVEVHGPMVWDVCRSVLSDRTRRRMRFRPPSWSWHAGPVRSVVAMRSARGYTGWLGGSRCGPGPPRPVVGFAKGRVRR